MISRNQINRTDSSKNEILKQHLSVLGRCYSTGRFEELFPLLTDDAVMESQWVLEPHSGKKEVIRYYTAKGEAFRQHDCCPHCNLIRLVGNLHCGPQKAVSINGEEPVMASVGLLYEDGVYAMLMHQGLGDRTNWAVVMLTLGEDDRIRRIDLCMPQLFQFDILESLDEI